MRRIAIVNRGEAAGRCLRAIKELRAEEASDLVAIVLYTEPDRAAPFVRQADEALSLGPALRAARGGKARPAYLDRSRVLAALRATRADAVWPGWGFVAEDSEFVAALEARDIIFLGPSSATLRAVGDKVAAKRLAEAHEIPVVPWSGGPVSGAAAAAAAARLGFPCMIKASAGGGGRGIRLVEDAARLPAQLASAVAEAEHAFGDGAVFLETRIERPRHVEVQFAADRFGRVVAVGLRDCSVQRRHQKVIEEAPPPDLDAEVARQLGEATVRLIGAVGYCGVGTAEFLLDSDGARFYFLEVNPRLQVEHGITELLTGWDLVKLQLRLGRGEPLPTERPVARGHAVEARVCAEDPGQGFAPAPGRIVLLDLPTGPGVRVDCNATTGTAVPAEFDSLVAKVLAHGATREAALARLGCALAEFRLVLQGGATNKGFLLRLLESTELRAGPVDVSWLDRGAADLAEAQHAEQALMVAAVLSYLDGRALQRLNFFAEAARGQPRHVPASTGWKVDLAYRGLPYRLAVHALGGWNYRLELDGRVCTALLLDQEEHACQLAVGERRFSVEYASSDADFQIEIDGQRHVVRRDSGGEIRATAPSVVVAIQVRPGQRVELGDELGVLETMKIEVPFHAPCSGTVREVFVVRNQRVAAGQLLVAVQAAEEQRGAPADHTARLRLPDGDDPLDEICDDEGHPRLDALLDADRGRRDRARGALLAAVRRILLGYDGDARRDEHLHEAFEQELPADLDPAIPGELAECRRVIATYADCELLFSRRPHIGADGTPGPSNDARLRLYLRRVDAAGAGIDADFRALLENALAHYDQNTLERGPALDRALLRLYAAHARRAVRHRLVESILRLLGRLARAGVELADDSDLARALGICVELRGAAPDSLSDAAAEARYTIFERPRIEQRTAAAAALVERTLAELPGSDGDGDGVDLDTLMRTADSAPILFDRIAAWAGDTDARRRALCLQSLVLRQYAPATPSSCRRVAAGRSTLARLDYAPDRVVFALLARASALAAAWRDLHTAAQGVAADTLHLEVIVLADDELGEDDLRALAVRLLADAPLAARRVCFSTLPRHAAQAAVACDLTSGAPRWRDDLMGLHPETARRLDLARLSHFSLRRLHAPRNVYAFHGVSRDVPDDERLFVLAEVRAALPGGMGTLHEAAFVHTFTEAARSLRRLRNEHEPWQRLHWNRLSLVVRPAFYLLPATLTRLARELLPATEHLGLEKIVVRLARRSGPDDPDEIESELVIEPSPDGPALITWREPHHEPLLAADLNSRRLAQARRRGVIYPYDALRLFTQGGHAGANFTEYDLDSGSEKVVSVAGRPPGQNRAAVVFGIITTPTAKHPEGMRRVCILSDPTRDFGALAAAECARLVAALDLAAAEQLPVEWFAQSAGARIAMDSGTENLDAVARVVRRIIHFTADGGEINVVVAGVNVGAQSYFDALATMLMHCRGILVMTEAGSMVLTGRAALEASGGVSAEDERGIGGFERVMGPNGQAQYYARDLAEAYDILLRHYGFTYVAPGESQPRRLLTTDGLDRDVTLSPYEGEAEGFANVGEILSDAANPGRKRPFAIRPLLRAVADSDGGWLERWSAMAGAETAVVADTHLGGEPVCMIGIENRPLPRPGFPPVDGPDHWTGATLFPGSSKKVARAINAASGNRPVVLLANLAGFDGSPESMRRLQLEYGAEIARAVVNFHGPFLFVVVSRYHGGAYVVFSRELNDQLHAVALTGSYASVIGGGPAASVIFPAEVRRRALADERIAALESELEDTVDPLQRDRLRVRLADLRAQVASEKHTEVAAEFDRIHSVERAREVGSLHAIIPPHELRRYLIDRLQGS